MYSGGMISGGGGSSGSTSIGSTIGGSPTSGCVLYTDGSGQLAQSSDADTTFILGRCRIDARAADTMYVSHFDMSGATQYALRSGSLGTTTVNSSAGSVYIAHANSLTYEFSTSGLVPLTDDSVSWGTSAKRVKNYFMSGYMEISEMTAPAAPAANKCRLFCQDNGAGKTQLMAIFASGAAQQVAIEP